MEEIGCSSGRLPEPSGVCAIHIFCGLSPEKRQGSLSFKSPLKIDLFYV
jgi:hypothetical protein